MNGAYSTAPARYAKGQLVVRPLDGAGGYKGRASYLCCALNMRWTHRERGYHASPAKLKRFERLFAEGWNATCFGELSPPHRESLI